MLSFYNRATLAPVNAEKVYNLVVENGTACGVPPNVIRRIWDGWLSATNDDTELLEEILNGTDITFQNHAWWGPDPLGDWHGRNR